jgi:hypothetical protein
MTDMHLSDERLSELGCDRASVPVNGERAHLDACAACRERLKEERLLSALLSGVPVEPPSASFVAGAKARYMRTTRSRTWLRAVVVLSLLAVAAGIWVLVAWAGSDAIAIDAAKTVATCAAVFRALCALAAASPLGFALCIALASTVLIAASGALAALIGNPARTRASVEARAKEV